MIVSFQFDWIYSMKQMKVFTCFNRVGRNIHYLKFKNEIEATNSIIANKILIDGMKFLFVSIRSNDQFQCIE